MRKTLLAMVGILLILVGGIIWYLAPQEQMNLEYSSFAVSDKIKEMISTKRMEFHLTQADVNNILIAQLASSNDDNTSSWKISGARFELNDDKLIAHVNLLYHGMIPVGTTSFFQLTWDSPYLKATPLYTQIKNWKVPNSMVHLSAPSLSVESFFPSFLKVRDVQFEAHSILFRLRF